MSWLMRLLGLERPDPPEHIRRAQQEAATAKIATEAARVAVDGYWQGHADRAEIEQKLRLKKVDADVGARRAARKPRGVT